MNDSIAGKRQVLLPILALFAALALVTLVLFCMPAQASQAAAHGILLRPGVDSPSTEVITIGVAADLSDVASGIGNRQANSVVLLANQINSMGGLLIGGVPYDIMVAIADSLCTNPTASSDAANWLVSQGAVGVIGHTCSGSTMVAQIIYETAGIPVISASSTSPQVTENGYATTFRVVTRDDQPPSRLGIYSYKHLGFRKVAVVEMNYGNLGLTDPFISAFTGLGGVISTRYTLADTSEYAATVASIAGEDVDAILYNGLYGAEAGQFSLAVDTGGLTTIPVAWISGEFDLDLLDAYLAAAGATAENDLAMLQLRDKDDMPLYTVFNTAYVAEAFPVDGDEGLEWGAFAYDAAHILINAIQTADSALPADILTALQNAGSHSGVVGEYYGFDAKGDVLPQWMWFGSVRSSQWTPLLAAAVVSDESGFGNSFNAMAYEGLQRAVADDLAIGTFFESASDGEYLPFLNQCAIDGNQMCIAVGFSMADAIKNAALAHPEAKYAIIDAEVIDPSENLRIYDFQEDEAGYMAGTLAGLLTESDVVGAVGGLEIPVVVEFVERYGHAAQCANPSASAIISYTNFWDPVLGADTAQAQMAQGADIIFAAAGPTGNGAILYATQNGAWGIGVDTDQWITLFGSGTVTGSDRLLSSAMKKVDNASYDAVSDLYFGLFTPGNLAFGLADDGVGLAPFHETEDDVSSTVKAWLDMIKAKIASSELDIYGACLTPQIIYLPVVTK